MSNILAAIWLRPFVRSTRPLRTRNTARRSGSSGAAGRQELDYRLCSRRSHAEYVMIELEQLSGSLFGVAHTI
jgi:hypothetical protein